MANNKFSIDSINKNSTLRKQLEGFVEEIVLCKNKIKTETESIKDITKEAKESLGIPPNIIKGLVNERMTPGTIDSKQNELDEISAVAENLGIIDAGV